MPRIAVVRPEPTYLESILHVLRGVPGVSDWMSRVVEGLARERLEFAASALPVRQSGLTPGGVPFELAFTTQAPGLRFLIDLSNDTRAVERLTAACTDAGIAVDGQGISELCSGSSTHSPFYASIGDGLRLYRSIRRGGFARARQLAVAASVSDVFDTMLERLTPIAGRLEPMFLGVHYGADGKRLAKLYVRGVSQFEEFRELLKQCGLGAFCRSFALLGRHLLPGLSQLHPSAHLIEVASDHGGNLSVKVDFAIQRHQLSDVEVHDRIQTWPGAPMPTAYSVVLERLNKLVAVNDPLSLHTAVGFGVSATTGTRLNTYIRPRFDGACFDPVAAFFGDVVRNASVTGQRIREKANARGFEVCNLDLVREDAGWTLCASLRNTGVLRMIATLDADSAIKIAAAIRRTRRLPFSYANGRLVMTFEPHPDVEDVNAEVEAMIHEILFDTLERKDA